METKLNIYQKLLTIQKKINGLGKDKKSFTYSYVTGDKVLGEIKPMMNELGLILKQEILSIENTRQDYATKTGTKSEILSKVDMRFTWIDCATGETDVNLFGANGQNDWEKGLGSALTYAERYFLLKYFHIATDEDDIDNDQRKEVKPMTEPPKHFSATATELPPLDDTNYKKVIELIKKKEFARVKKAIEIHSLLVEQKNDLIDNLTGNIDLLKLLQTK